MPLATGGSHTTHLRCSSSSKVREASIPFRFVPIISNMDISSVVGSREAMRPRPLAYLHSGSKADSVPGMPDTIPLES